MPLHACKSAGCDDGDLHAGALIADALSMPVRRNLWHCAAHNPVVATRIAASAAANSGHAHPCSNLATPPPPTPRPCLCLCKQALVVLTCACCWFDTHVAAAAADGVLPPLTPRRRKVLFMAAASVLYMTFSFARREVASWLRAQCSVPRCAGALVLRPARHSEAVRHHHCIQSTV